MGAGRPAVGDLSGSGDPDRTGGDPNGTGSDPGRTGWLAWAAASGVLGGLATLVRPDWLLFVPFAAVVGLLCNVQRRRHVMSSAVMLLGIVMVLAPWWCRNWGQVHEFVPTTLQVGASLYDGLNPRATGGSDMRFVPEFVEQERQRGMADKAFEVRLDRRLFEAAVEWAARHPGRVSELAAIKFVRMWNVWPNDALNGGILVRLITAATFLPAVGAGFGRHLDHAPPALADGAVLVAGGLSYALAPGLRESIRYREPPMLGLLVFAAVALARGGSAIARPVAKFCWRSFKWSVLLVAVATAVAVPLFYQRFDDEVRRRIEEKLAAHYPDLKVSVRAARFLMGKGIEIRGISVVEPNVSGPDAELAYIEELLLEGDTEWQELLRGELRISRVVFRRPTIRVAQRPDGSWMPRNCCPCHA